MVDRVNADLLAAPAQLLPAREQMALTLMFHIVFVPFGIALPTMMLIANYKGLKRNDTVALTLARRWSHAAGLTFAVGAASGTVLSFEMGLLWPGLTGKFGEVFGLPFAIEGVLFFLEAILVAIYIYGWRRLKPWTHFWLGMPIPFVAIGGAFSIISANAWMNMPAGFTIDANGQITDVDPIGAIFNKALPYEFGHFLVAAYMAAAFAVASIYVVGWLKGRRDRYHRLGILIPLTIATVLTPVQFVVGDLTAVAVFKDQPAKFAAMEVVTESGTHQPEVLFGRYDSATNTVEGGLSVPGLNSWLAGGSVDTYVPGLDQVPPENRPSNVTIVHWAFDIMVGVGTVLLLLAFWFFVAYWRRRDVPDNRVFLWFAASAGVLTYIAVEAGWIVTEVGRQPWIVYNIMRTEEAVTNTDAGTLWISFSLIALLYLSLAIGTITVLRAMSRRWRRSDQTDDELAVYGPRPSIEEVSS
ncbi:putative cytochrome bd-I oxidase subunit I [Actinoplanes missouriensis 431]|uniref:Putative cytochrome bd-I oxidase subunit I n=1 Tax=Actinoplanes missouriensis (strain ATCC 14538 / DSM 43046 / CBS 188.64 / JCM 3121 / NBRC 102363 / NCIMB 12654 / NRRL B-3342 / UNCC 431) TaxID=512565 RepID=I0H675_ACTM4|nr:putative cytochrome bd-I oxidase subunit I [Actinoplanes missouriensis 431]